MTTTNEDVLRAVFDAWNEGIEPGAAALREHFTSDCPWEQTGVPTTTGPDEAAELFLGMSAMGWARIEVEVRNLAASGDVVFTERVDHMVRADGSRAATFPVVGVTEFGDGKIRGWREYFDSALFAQLNGDAPDAS
jgi:limonene-1,2-epoxide hydrolase